ATQDPNDLYGPDSVLFKSKQLLVPCPPQTGQAVVPVYFRNDTYIIGVQVPLTWTGPAVLDSVSFLGSRISYLFNKQVTIDNPNRKVLVTAHVNQEQPVSDGRGMLFKLYFSTSDTGDLIIDTVSGSPLPQEHLRFTREDSVTYTPQYRQGEFHLSCLHDPNDPGVPDSVTFYPPYAYYPLPSGPGKFYAHLRITNSDSVGAIILPLTWSGPAHFDSTTFRETVMEDSLRIMNVDTSNHQTLMALIPVHYPPIPPTRGLFTTLCFTLTDKTGLVQIDSTFIAPLNHILFTTTEPQGYRPQFISEQFPVLTYWPGDANFDGMVDVSDVIYLVNYIYKSGPAPPHLISADVNGPDRSIDAQDIIYLINYLFKSGPNPHPGDPW
ncbi:MAG: dockerin type I repeat-containing protein, partial [Candidatus Zixiibacteriota bacterium]